MKTRCTIYTEHKVAAARRNADTYDWARELKDEAVRKAERYVELGAEFLWRLVPPQTLPRSYAVNQKAGSPVTGKAIDRFGNYPYTGDPAAAPWKIVDPSSGCTFPTNDFAAYYKSGLDEHAIFRPERADRALLINELYPEKGPDWGVDDGFGWVDKEGSRFTFIAYYVHWFLWYNEHTGMIQDAISSLRDAYLYTGDCRYARAGIILLDRIADIYPELDISVYDKTVYLNSHGGETGRGKAIGSIWETFLVKDLVSAYDAFFPAMDDPETIGFLAEKAAMYKLNNPKCSGEAIRRNIEEGIVRQVYAGVRSAAILGNTGFHQSALAMAAVVYDTLPETREWLDFVFRTGGRESKPDWHVTGGNLAAALVNEVDRDGHGNEAAPHYNRLWLTSLQSVADILRGYDRCPEFDLYNHIKFRKMYAAPYPLLLSGKYTAQIGDSGKTGNPDISIDLQEALKAFEVYGDPIYAQMAYLLNGNKLDGLHGDIFAEAPERLADRLRAVINAHGTLRIGSSNLTGYGFAALQDGGSGTMRDVWLYYGRTFGHGHRDALNLGLHAFGLDLAPDLGYPEYADSRDKHRWEWVQHTISHNTVLVDEAKQKPQWVGKPNYYDGQSGFVKLIDVEAPEAYPQTSMYRRTVGMIRIDDSHSYMIDWFRVRGGTSHHFSFHGPEGDVVTEGLSLEVQSGTYAGAHVAYGERTDSIEGTGYEGSGFHYLQHVRHDEAPGDPFSIEWHAADTWNAMEGTDPVRLRLTMIGGYDRVSLAEGIPPRNKPGNPSSLTYAIVRRQAAHPHGQLESLFASVIEPYRERRVQSIRSLPVHAWNGGPVAELEANAIAVTLSDGRVDTAISALHPDRMYRIDGRLAFQGGFGLFSERGTGKEPYAYVHDGTVLGYVDAPAIREPFGHLAGTVADFTKELSVSNAIVAKLELQALEPSVLIGRIVCIDNDGERNAVYEIKGIERRGSEASGEAALYSLDIGDTTLIRRYANPGSANESYVYDIAEGARLRIPLAYEKRTEA